MRLLKEAIELFVVLFAIGLTALIPLAVVCVGGALAFHLAERILGW